MTGDGRRQPINPMLAGLIAGVVIAVVIGIMAKINLDFAAPWQKTHTVTAQVSDADGIAYGSDVRVAGRLVGQVTGINAQGDHTNVTFHIDDSEWPLPGDTRASIRLATLLGQKYVELQPGSNTTAKLADDGVIGLQSTRPVVDFDQLLSTFDQPTRDNLTTLIRTVSGALQGQEGTLQQVFPTLRDLSVHSQIPTGELAARDPEVNNILINLGVTADQLSASRDNLAGVIDNLNSITGALAQNQSALEGAIKNGDQLAQTTDAVLGHGGAQQLNTGLQQLPALTTQAKTLLGDLIPQTQLFKTSGADRSTVNLMFSIGDATSQSNASGYFLRQNLAGLDVCGLTPLCGPQPLNLPSLPALPALPTPSLPPLAVPSLPVTVPGLAAPACTAVQNLGLGVPTPGCPAGTQSCAPVIIAGVPVTPPGCPGGPHCLPLNFPVPQGVTLPVTLGKCPANNPNGAGTTIPGTGQTLPPLPPLPSPPSLPHLGSYSGSDDSVMMEYW